MYLFEIVSVDPLEPHGEMKYHSIAADVDSLLFVELPGPRIARHCAELGFLEAHKTARGYTGICYDHKDGCFWGCSSKNNNLIYKLSDTFQEVDRFIFQGYDSDWGFINGISYDRQDDCLILTFSRHVATVDKRTFCEQAVSHCTPCPPYQCVRSCQYYYYLSRQCCMEVLSIVKDGQLLIHSCLPHGHQILGMVDTCGEQGSMISFLSVKQGGYYYVIKGMLVSKDQSADCPCPAPATPVPTPGEDCHHHHHDRDHHLDYDCDSHHHSHFDWALGLYGGASIVESIALEQTALSHILNAEGEKIQKVLAVSDRTADFLDVNHSVVETINKVTHLEHVLYSKLELAYRILRESRGQTERNP